MIALAGTLGVVAALALAGCVALVRRLDQLQAAQLAHERAISAERGIRVLELERLLDQVRAAAVGASPATPEELALRARAGQIDVGGQPVKAIPKELVAELEAIEDAEHRGELTELVTYRLAQGESPEAILSDVFA